MEEKESSASRIILQTFSRWVESHQGRRAMTSWGESWLVMILYVICSQRRYAGLKVLKCELMKMILGLRKAICKQKEFQWDLDSIGSDWGWKRSSQLMMRYHMLLESRKQRSLYSFIISRRIVGTLSWSSSTALMTAPSLLTRSNTTSSLFSSNLKWYFPKQSIALCILTKLIMSCCMVRSCILSFSIGRAELSITFPKHLKALLIACRVYKRPYFFSMNWTISLAFENLIPYCKIFSIMQQASRFLLYALGGSISFFPKEMAELTLNSLYFLRRVEQPMWMLPAIYFNVHLFFADSGRLIQALNISFISSIVSFVRFTLERLFSRRGKGLESKVESLGGMFLLEAQSCQQMVLAEFSTSFLGKRASRSFKAYQGAI